MVGKVNQKDIFWGTFRTNKSHIKFNKKKLLPYFKPKNFEIAINKKKIFSSLKSLISK